MKIYTVILMISGDMETNSVQSFTTFEAADNYRYILECKWGTSNIDIVENILY